VSALKDSAVKRFLAWVISSGFLLGSMAGCGQEKSKDKPTPPVITPGKTAPEKTNDDKPKDEKPPEKKTGETESKTG
jgi:hypothetical protein